MYMIILWILLKCGCGWINVSVGRPEISCTLSPAPTQGVGNLEDLHTKTLDSYFLLGNDLSRSLICQAAQSIFPYFTAKAHYSHMLCVLFFKNESCLSYIKFIFGLPVATQTFLLVVLTGLVVRPQEEGCWRKEVHLVGGAGLLTRQITFCSLLNWWREARGLRLTYFSFFEWSLSSELHEPCEAGKRAMVLETKTEFLSFNTEENASGYYYLWFMGCIAIWPVSHHSRQKTLTLCLWWTLVVSQGQFSTEGEQLHHKILT